MGEFTPYIIVNEQRIFPMEWSAQSGSATAERKGQEERTFGVVDRVTISAEAREKYRWHAAQAGTDSSTPDDPLNNAPDASVPLLAYSPKRLR